MLNVYARFSSKLRTSQVVKTLVVEDELLVALAMSQTLEDMGVSVVGPAHDLDSGLSLVESEHVDFAFVDLNLRNIESLPIADKLRGKGVPFVFLTGYAHPKLPPEMEEVTLLQKPCTPEQIKQAILDSMPGAALDA